MIVATHGYTGTFTDYTFIFEDLASRGYVVVSVAHTYETTAVEFPDGRVVRSVFGSHFAADSLRIDDKSLAFARSMRLRDLVFVMDELERLNSRAGGAFPGHLDLSRVAVLGHSLGGLVAILSVAREPRFKAAVVLDMPITSPVMGTEKPVLILSAGREQSSTAECELWRNLEGPRFLVNLRGAEHLTPSDAVWLAKDLPGLTAPTGTMGPEETVAMIRNYIAAFLDTALWGRTNSSLLSGPSKYKDAAVTTQKQPLCGELVWLK